MGARVDRGRRFLTRSAGALVIWAALSGPPSPVGHAQAAPERCPTDAPWESLCNVEPELRRSYLWIERVADLTFFRERISGVVRNRQVTVEWAWEITDPDFLGGFSARNRRVVLPVHLRGGPDRVEAAIIAHELWHGYGDLTGRHRPETFQNCLEDEREAFMVGMLFYDRLYALTPERRQPTPGADAHFHGLRREWEERDGTDATLATMADEHVRNRGYFLRCLLQTGPNI